MKILRGDVPDQLSLLRTIGSKRKRGRTPKNRLPALEKDVLNDKESFLACNVPIVIIIILV